MGVNTMFGKIGILELIVILAIALLLFGGKVANLGPALGKAIRGFKKELKGNDQPKTEELPKEDTQEQDKAE